jgi:hypothetical protein
MISLGAHFETSGSPHCGGAQMFYNFEFSVLEDEVFVGPVRVYALCVRFMIVHNGFLNVARNAHFFQHVFSQLSKSLPYQRIAVTESHSLTCHCVSRSLQLQSAAPSLLAMIFFLTRACGLRRNCVFGHLPQLSPYGLAISSPLYATVHLLLPGIYGTS